jgi:hypothetical protein
MKPPRFADQPSDRPPWAYRWQATAGRLGRQMVWLLVAGVFLVLESLVTARDRAATCHPK